MPVRAGESIQGWLEHARVCYHPCGDRCNRGALDSAARPCRRNPNAGPLPGGMMHFGIPAYRLPREDLMMEVRLIEVMGVHIVLNHKAEDLLAEKTEGGIDAAFVAIGAHLSRRVAMTRTRTTIPPSTNSSVAM